MGINAINCKGEYAETGKVELGNGIRSSSDFDRTDLLKVATLMVLTAAGTLVAGCVKKDTEHKPAETYYMDKNADVDSLAQGQFPFPVNADPNGMPQYLKATFVYPGDTRGFHSERTNSTYWIVMETFPDAGQFDVYRKPPSGIVEMQHVDFSGYLMSGNEGPLQIKFGDATLAAELEVYNQVYDSDTAYVKMAELGQ